MKETQKQKIVKYMLKFGSITSWEAYEGLGITQFATRINELKQEGYTFKMLWEKRKNKEGKTVRFKRFYLSNK